MNDSLKIYKGATVAFSDDDVAALEPVLTRINSRGKTVEEPPEFPLTNAQVVFNGDQATISVSVNGRKNRRVCRLTRAKITQPKNDAGPIVITGIAVELEELRLPADEQRITASIVSYRECATCR